MRAPQFWHKKNIITYCLLPFSGLYLLVYYFKSKLTNPQKINCPIICVGNLVAGGAGKTPIAIEIGKMLKEANIDFSYLSSGYGGEIKDLTKVDQSLHSAGQVGDEPLLLSEISTAFISKNRLFGAQQIAALPNKKLIIMDDGLQNFSIKKDFSIVVIDGKYGFGNGLVIPAGPLRETINMGLKKADLIIIVGEDKFLIGQKYAQATTIVSAQIKVINGQKFANQPVLAFCGIGRPDKFFDSLKENNIQIIAKYSYPDHYQYRDSEIKSMIDEAEKNNAIILTTKKDWIRLSQNFREQIAYLDIAIEFADKNFIKQKLLSLVK